MVRCRIGEEKITALSLMRKFIAFQMTDEPLQIKSVVAPEGIKGHIYIEAFKQPHVKAAINNIGNLRVGAWKQQVFFFFLRKYKRKLICLLFTLKLKI